MGLDELLGEKQPAILNRWLELILDGYPESTGRFLRSESDRFRNPIGATLARELEGLYRALRAGSDREVMVEHLDPIIRIRAIQDFSPADAVGFVFQLKRAIREELREDRLGEEWSVFESQIDELALQAFDVFMKCREQIYQLRADEVKRQAYVRLDRANRNR
jgi:hypothetical protein